MSGLDALNEDLKKLQEALSTFSEQFLRKSSVLIGTISTQEYMRNAGSPNSRRSAGDKGPLRIVKARLARSLTGARGRIAATGGSPEAINRIQMLQDGLVRLVKGSKVPYAATHEYGGQMNHTVPVTDKMRGFFWFRHYQTGRDKWKAMALTKKDQFKITGKIPARPYLGPALQDALPELQKMGEEDLHKFFGEALGV